MSDELAEIDLILEKAKNAQIEFERGGNQELSTAADAAAWALMKPNQNELAESAVAETALATLI